MLRIALWFYRVYCTELFPEQSYSQNSPTRCSRQGSAEKGSAEDKQKRAPDLIRCPFLLFIVDASTKSVADGSE